MSALTALLSDVIDPYREALAYEYLYSIEGSSLSSISSDTVNRGLLPSQRLEEVLVFEECYELVKEHFDSKIGRFDVAVNGTPGYPARLADANERVPLLYYRGDINLVDRPSVSIVGARAASEKGLARAARLAAILVGKNVAVVSGLAAGVDTAALTSCISHGGRAIGVIGTPIDECYPKENRELQLQIAREHLLVSQVPFYRYAVQPSDSRKQYFRERNVTMAAVSNATVIVEASDTSGSLIQARACIKQGRPLFIMRSCLDNPRVSWPRRFVDQGARILDDANELLRAIGVEVG